MFEQLYSDKWISHRPAFAFVMGLAYAVFGIGSALFVFPSEPALAAVAFTSLLLLPSLNRLLSNEELEAASEGKFSILSPFKDHRDIFEVYLFLFLGVMLAFAFFAIVLPSNSSSELFSSQLNMLGIVGKAVALGDSFGSLVANNIIVFAFVFFASFIYGAGSIFIIVWNASVWGAVLGVIARDAASVVGQSPFSYFLATVASAFPHMFFEAGAYFLAAFAGAIVGKAVVTERIFSNRTANIMQDAVIVFFTAVAMLFIAAFIEVFIVGAR